MAQPLYRQYLRQARRLASLDPRRPQQGNLRRAVSTAYYALFHFLVDQSSRFLVGSTNHREALRRVAARAFQHGEMADAAKSFRSGTLPPPVTRIAGVVSVSSQLRDVTRVFVLAQEQRPLADCDLAETFLRSDVTALIGRIEKVIENWDGIRSDPATRLFLLGLLTWNRVRGR